MSHLVIGRPPLPGAFGCLAETMTRPRERDSSEIRVSASHSQGRAEWPTRSTIRSKACDYALPAQLAPTLIPSTPSAQLVFRLVEPAALPEESHSGLI